MKTYRLATIPGDGIGKEVVPAGQQVLEALAQRRGAFGFEFTEFGWGADWYRRYGVMMPDDGLDQLRGMYAILFGSAGDPRIPDHVTLWAVSYANYGSYSVGTLAIASANFTVGRATPTGAS